MLRQACLFAPSELPFTKKGSQPSFKPLASLDSYVCLFSPLCTSGFFLLIGYNKLGFVHCSYLGVSDYNLNVFFCLKIFFTFTSSVDPDEIAHYAAFHLGLHCLPKYPLSSFPNIRVKGRLNTYIQY